MVDIIHTNMTLSQAKAIENALANQDTLSANLDYIAMMTDTELPSDEVQENGTFTEVSES